jgi:PAS domain S-box-containing protein
MKSLVFRIWFPFVVFFSCILVVIAYYYSVKQEQIYIENRKSELHELAKSIALGVELSVENDNLNGLKKALDLAKSSDDFEKAAVVVKDEQGKKIEQYSNPVNSKISVLNLDSAQYIVQKFPFKTELISGEIYIVSSKAKIDEVIFNLNLPLYIILIGLFVISAIIFYVFAKRLVTPINGLNSLSIAIKNNKELDFRKDFSTAATEVEELGNTLVSLFHSLKVERQRNDEILENLENQVIERTKENNQLSLVAKHALNGVLIADKDKKILYANKSLCEITGYELHELIGQTPKMFQFEKTDSSTIARINSALSRNEVVKEQILNRSKNGREYWLELNIVPVFENGEVTSYIAVETDVTERITDENLLKQSEEQNRRILDNAAEMIHTLDERGNILWANRSWLKNIGISSEEASGRNITEFLDEKTREEFQEVMPKLMQGESINNLECVFVSMKMQNIDLRGKTIPLYENGKFIGSQAYLHNITEMIEAQKTINQKSLLQDLMMRISTKYINLPVDQLDQTILDSLRDIATFVKADRAYIFNYYLDQGYCEYKYEWVEEGIEPQMNDYKIIQLDTMPYWLEKHKNKEFVIVEDSSALTDKNIQQLLVTEGIKSLITIPVHDDDKLVGFVGFDLIKIFRVFSHEEKEILVLFSQMLVNVYKRLDYIRELNQSKQKIEEVNASLEQRVAENTKRNLDLSKNIIEQEKLATIGEISAGIAHDLNTPLGTIKVGADNVRYMLSSILKNELSSLSKEDLELIHNRVETVETEMFVGGLQLRKEKIEILSQISIDYPNLDGAIQEKMVDFLVKARVNKSESDFIQRIFSSSNPLLFVEVLYQVQMAAAQLETIKKSSDKAVKVVQDVRSFIKGEVSQNEKREFNLRENIATVLGIFNYELRQNVDLKFVVDPNLVMVGYDVKLFQLWSNLIKNAFEAMDEQEEKFIGIYSTVELGQIQLVFENNGPKIQDDVMDNMFKKFYTTKSKKSGSGLGLSIVKNILNEHNATIEVNSNEQSTKFIVTFAYDRI